jgi:hypothetical protein
MPHEFHDEDVRTSYTKIQRILGDTDKFQHPTEKAANLANYYENENLDPLTLPTRESIGPLSAEKE